MCTKSTLIARAESINNHGRITPNLHFGFHFFAVLETAVRRQRTPLSLHACLHAPYCPQITSSPCRRNHLHTKNHERDDERNNDPRNILLMFLRPVATWTRPACKLTTSSHGLGAGPMLVHVKRFAAVAPAAIVPDMHVSTQETYTYQTLL